MEKLTKEILHTLIGKTIYWQLPDGLDGICTIISVDDRMVIAETIRGFPFQIEYVGIATFKSYGRFLRM